LCYNSVTKLTKVSSSFVLMANVGIILNEVEEITLRNFCVIAVARRLSIINISTSNYVSSISTSKLQTLSTQNFKNLTHSRNGKVHIASRNCFQ